MNAANVPRDTCLALQSLALEQCSRSLYYDRFAQPDLEKDARRKFFSDGFGCQRLKSKSEFWKEWLKDGKLGFGLNPEAVLFAQLQSRLMVNMAGGVMENAGLCLDRFGLPYIPGSAVKGCARRMALAALHDWCDTGTKPGEQEGDNENLFKAACAVFDTPADMLAAIARVFGWCEMDWKTDSDFAWACSAVANNVASQAASTGRDMTAQGNALGNGVNVRLSPEGATHPNQWPTIRAQALALLGGDVRREASCDTARAPRIKDFAGSISFLPAYPVDLGKTGKVDGLPAQVPELGKLELDVVTVHHKQYYAEPAEPKDVPHSDSKWQKWKREHDEWQADWGTAPDVEEPVPNVFPAVALGHVFAFALVSLRNCSEDDLKHAHYWLADGLQTFGLGAKTNAGYGWFDCRNEVQEAIQQVLADAERKRLEEQRLREDERRGKAEVEARRRKAEELKAATANMTLEQKADYELAQLTVDQFRGRLDQFLKRDKLEQDAMLRAMRFPQDQPGSRRKFWDDLKAKAQKGGKPAQIEQAIRQLSKQMYPGKEVKMP